MFEKRKRFHWLLLSIASLLFLSGCVSLLQEVTIHEDGSGMLGFTIGVDSSLYPQFQEQIPEGFQLEDLLSSLIRDENVTNVTKDQYVEDGRTYDSIVLEMSDFAAVFAEERRIGPVNISLIVEDGVYDYRQSINVANSNLSIPGVNLLDMASVGYSVRLNTPQILYTDGVQEAAGVSLWEVPLSQLLQEGEAFYFRADYVLEPYEGVFIAWETFFPYVMIGFLALGFLAILIVIIVNTVGKGDKPQKINF